MIKTNILGAVVGGFVVLLPALALAQLYCPDSKKFYPDVPWCKSYWQQVPARPTAQQPRAQTAADKAKEEARRQRDAARKAAAAKTAREAEEKVRAEAAARQKRIDEMAAERAAAEQAAAEKRQAAEQAVALARAEQQDRDRAYTRESVDEVIVDYPQMTDDAKIITSGYFNSLGQIAALSGARISTNDIYLYTSQLSRDTRLVLLRCQDFMMDGCLITVWAHRGCTVTAFGMENDAAPCFVVEALRPGLYDHPAVDRILR